MFVLLRSFYQRLWLRKNNILVYLVLTVLALVAGLYLSEQTPSKTIAITKSIPALQSNTQYHIKEIDKFSESDLILQKYDVYVYEKDGELYMNSLEGMHVKAPSLASLEKGVSHKEKGKGETIFGYIMMFVMMQAIFYLMLFGDDKETHMLTRLQATPLQKHTYLMSMILFASIATLLPVMLCLCIAKVLGFAIGFSLPIYALLLFLLSIMSVSVAFVIQTLVERSDTANMICSACFVLTSALSGCFLELNQTGWLTQVCNLLPQKQLLQLTNDIQQNTITNASIASLCYVLGFITFCLAIALLRTKRIFQMNT